MSEEWRLLLTGASSASKNMAIDRAVLVENSKGNVPPTVRFYEWMPSAISIGYFQSLEEEIDLEMCKVHGVEYVRRITGGGAVFHENELTYSIVIPESHSLIPKNIMESYGNICGAVMKGLDEIGVNSRYMPINDIISGGKKISGNAQTRKEKTVLQHGTVIIDVDVNKMFSILKVPNEKIKDKLISDVKERVTSLKDILGRDVLFDEVSGGMKKGFEKQFGIQLIEGDLTSEEKRLTYKFEKECFSAKEWNHKR
jgi:lipoate-protein ligase A